jgi:hypothetical protein
MKDFLRVQQWRITTKDCLRYNNEGLVQVTTIQIVAQGREI